MLTIGITDRRDIPHEPGEWIEIRKLSWKQLADARKVRQEVVFSSVRAMGGEVINALPKRCGQCGEEKHEGACPPPEQRTDASAADPTNEYDRGTLLHTGIVAWSYDKPANVGNIDELDDVTAAWATAEIVAYNTVPSEEERKN
jgi:hypothetical protein